MAGRTGAANRAEAAAIEMARTRFSFRLSRVRLLSCGSVFLFEVSSSAEPATSPFSSPDSKDSELEDASKADPYVDCIRWCDLLRGKGLPWREEAVVEVNPDGRMAIENDVTDDIFRSDTSSRATRTALAMDLI